MDKLIKTDKDSFGIVWQYTADVFKILICIFILFR